MKSRKNFETDISRLTGAVNQRKYLFCTKILQPVHTEGVFAPLGEISKFLLLYFSTKFRSLKMYEKFTKRFLHMIVFC